jgi:hypothetical protein
MTFDVNKDIAFTLMEKRLKTLVYDVQNTQADCSIGLVKWYGPWRHYCFFPETETVFSDRCLLRIGKFVEELNKKHKEKREKKP